MSTAIETENTRAIAANTAAISELVEALGGEIAARQAAIAAAVAAAKAYTDSVAMATYTLPIAAADVLGGMKPDGTTITVDPTTGVASAVVDVEALPFASSASPGVVKVDGTTIVIHDGILSVAGGGGGSSLSGVTFDLTTTDGLFAAVKAIAQALGADVNE